jgi:hypothetical protein
MPSQLADKARGTRDKLCHIMSRKEVQLPRSHTQELNRAKESQNP